MEDVRIIELYFERNERALEETERKYGRYCHTVAYNILQSDSDAEECVNDTYLRAWDAIPPHRPARLSTFLGKITRNLALNRYAHNRAAKRYDGVVAVLDELSEVLADPEGECNENDSAQITAVLNRFLETLPKQSRVIFLRRYWYLYSVKAIAQGMGISENRVKVTLHRAREKLKAYLEKEGIEL